MIYTGLLNRGPMAVRVSLQIDSYDKETHVFEGGYLIEVIPVGDEADGTVARTGLLGDGGDDPDLH